MINNSEILISTTSTLDGYEVIKYIKPITSHIVIGTNYFSDFVASWTDFLGGQSNSYQKKISETYQIALKEIRSNALQIGANGVIGLHIDIDEISGKGKSMFMITASGTAVIIKDNRVESNRSQETIKNKMISKDEMSIFLKKKKIHDEIKSNSLVLDNELWEFITENQFHEIAEDIITLSGKEYTENGADSLTNKLRQYLYALPESEIKALLYRLYLDGKKVFISNLAFDIIKQKSFIDTVILRKELENLDIEKKYKLLNLLTVPKDIYVKADIVEFQKLLSLVREKFPIVVEVTKKKRLLSDKEDDIWICACKSKNSIYSTNCQSCGMDKYGFKQGSTGPLEAIDYLEGCIDYLEKI